MVNTRNDAKFCAKQRYGALCSVPFIKCDKVDDKVPGTEIIGRQHRQWTLRYSDTLVDLWRLEIAIVPVPRRFGEIDRVPARLSIAAQLEEHARDQQAKQGQQHGGP